MHYSGIWLPSKITKKEQEKLSTCITVIQNLQIMYPDYQYQITPSIVAALGSIPKSVNGYVCQLGFDNMEVKRILQKLLSISVIDTAKICKSFLKFLVFLKEKYTSLMSQTLCFKFLLSHDILCFAK